MALAICGRWATEDAETQSNMTSARRSKSVFAQLGRVASLGAGELKCSVQKCYRLKKHATQFRKKSVLSIHLAAPRLRRCARKGRDQSGFGLIRVTLAKSGAPALAHEICKFTSHSKLNLIYGAHCRFIWPMAADSSVALPLASHLGRDTGRWYLDV